MNSQGVGHGPLVAGLAGSALLFLALNVLPAVGSGSPPPRAARCRDGHYSFSHNRSGTCSDHGGVAVWFLHGSATKIGTARVDVGKQKIFELRRTRQWPTAQS